MIAGHYTQRLDEFKHLTPICFEKSPRPQVVLNRLIFLSTRVILTNKLTNVLNYVFHFGKGI